MLSEEFLKPINMTQTQLAERIGVSYVRVNEIVNARRGITPDTALRLSTFGATPDFWLNGQLALGSLPHPTIARNPRRAQED
ncbi:MAG TPA: HigA family addiction module antitoxin, partial [Candidatus Sumerlaeota bacterium]|nr:HigA family addiction module antitoxin [Candidatus Sumerlaeota bacterium]